MDKPLDFSMNSSKEKTKNTTAKELDDYSKREKDANTICKAENVSIRKGLSNYTNDLNIIKPIQ